MEVEEKSNSKKSVRMRADKIKNFRCKNLIAVIEDPENPRNIGTVIRNVNALGVDRVYVIDSRQVLPDDWQELRHDSKLSKLSVSAIKWTYLKRFHSTEACLDHLEANLTLTRKNCPLPSEERSRKMLNFVMTRLSQR